MPDPAPIKYLRLPGSGLSRKGASFFAATRISCRLWLGDDHLLQVESTGGYAESYKRFYFHDIQAICLRKTKTWFGINLALSVLTGLFLLWTLSVKDSGGVIALGIFTVVFGFFLLINVLRGSTCTCQLKTAVHLEELPSLRRRRNAERVIARIKPIIEAAQGSPPGETLAQQYADLLANASAVPGRVSRLAVRAYDSRIHQILFFAVLADAAAGLLDIFLPGVPAILLNMLTGVVMIGSVVIALVKQHETDLKPAVRTVTWLTAVFSGIGYFIGYAMMAVMIPTHQLDGTQWEYIKALAALRPLETPWWLAILISGVVVAGALGGLGLLLLRQHWREKEAVA